MSTDPSSGTSNGVCGAVTAKAGLITSVTGSEVDAVEVAFPGINGGENQRAAR